MPFLLDGNPTESEISEAVNYLLANFDSSVSSDPNTGQISGPSGEVIGYLYQYMAVKYADSFDGSVNFSNSPTNRLYFGIRNTNDAAESSNPADYIWNQVTGGFGLTKSLWYISTGGRQIQFVISVSAPDTGWLVDPGSSIDLDVVTSGNIPVIAEAFVAYFTPAILQVPRSGNPLSPSFSGITPTLYATDAGSVVPFVDAQTDTAVNFVNGTWRIGNSSTTGNGDISYTNLTIGNPTDGGDFAVWPNPTAMPSSPAYITVPVRYKNNSGIVSQAGVATIQLIFADPGATGNTGATGSNGPSVDISGYTTFVQNAGGAFNPATATLSASYANITSPTFSWAITGATPSSSTASSVVITPLSSATNVVVTLTVNGSNLSSPISRTINMPIVYDGAPGEAGSNGVMSAFPTIYQWTGSSTPPTRPTTTSIYTWGTGSYTAPTNWFTSPPSNTTAGNYLWSITVPLNTTATTVTSTLDWTNTSFPIRAIAYNGANGSPGDPGATGSAGAATFVVTRFANDSSAPSNAEVNAVIGRNPVAGDIVTVSYNNYNNATVYRFVTSWVLFTTYITGSLIVENTITADKMVTGLMSADNVLTRGLTVRDNSGNILLASGTPLNFTNINASSGWLNSNISISAGAISGIGTGSGTVVDNTAISISGGAISGIGSGTGTVVDNAAINISSGAINGIGTGSGTVVANNQISISGGAITGIGTGSGTAVANSAISINSNGTLSGAGGGTVSLVGLGAGSFATLSQITSSNATTYIAGAAIGTAQVGVLTANNIGANTIDASKIAANTITAGQIAANTITAGQIAASTITASQIAANTITADNMITGLMSADNVLTRGLTVRDNSGNILLASGSPLNFANITPASGWLNSNISISAGAITGIGTGSGTAVANSAISINSNGTLTGAGGGSVSLSGLGAGSFATLSQITSSNATTYIAGAAIGTAQIGVLTANNIGADTIDANKLTSITVNASKNITVGTAAVSGTTMTGSGAILNGNGTAAIGNATTNISFNGTQMTLNGNVVATGNINLNGVSQTQIVQTAIAQSVTTGAAIVSGSVTVSGVAGGFILVAGNTTLGENGNLQIEKVSGPNGYWWDRSSVQSGTGSLLSPSVVADTIQQYWIPLTTGDVVFRTVNNVFVTDPTFVSGNLSILATTFKR